MFGDNPIRSIQRDPGHLAVEDIFYTIQGEGPYGGVPALFIRLAGCNLACTFCDTEFETQAEALTPIQSLVNDIKARFTPAQRRLVVMTGGEPMRQNWSLLAEFLLGTGTDIIQVETAGTLWQHDLERLLSRIHFVCSPKTPGVHKMIAIQCKDWKYIVKARESDATDGLPNRGTQRATIGIVQQLYRPSGPGQCIWLSPCDEYDPGKNHENLMAVRNLALAHGYRVSLQMHKTLGVA
jgi:7-carboxy-7-deazaguanine synthase